jgi:hypothetical protein
MLQPGATQGFSYYSIVAGANVQVLIVIARQSAIGVGGWGRMGLNNSVPLARRSKRK